MFTISVFSAFFPTEVNVMYRCKTCLRTFSAPKIRVERHGLSCPPYETFSVCPFCEENDFAEIVTRCRACGAKMQKEGPFCSEACRKRAEHYRQNERERRRAEAPINRVLREKEAYNRQHGTAYSYGQYVALCENNTRRGGKKKCTKTKKHT